MFIMIFLNHKLEWTVVQHTQINKVGVYLMDFRIMSIQYVIFKRNFATEMGALVILKNVKCLIP